MKPCFSFLLAVAAATLGDRFHSRALAVNDDVVMTPFESSRGTESLDADVTVSFRNAVVTLGSDDRHFRLPAAATDIPRGILLNDQVDTGEPGAVRKQVAIFGLFPETLPGVASGAIAANTEVVADLVTPGYVKALPTTTGTYVVFGRARFAVINAGDPVSIIHEVPRVVTLP